MALAPWGALGGGKFRTDAEEERRRSTGEQGRTLTGNWERNDREKKVSAALEKVAKEVGTEHITAGWFLFIKSFNSNSLVHIQFTL